MEKIFIGVAWPYANGPLHLGHIAGSLLPPDIFARYHRMKGNRVLMVSGSDEHGTPITLEAEKQGKTPKEFVDYYHNEHVECLKKLDISFDLFSRTTNENHAKVVQDMFLTLLKKGYIYKKKSVGLYCNKCNRWLPDRYVEGKCPECGFENARGDQCEKCGKTLNADELGEPRCKNCSTTPDKRETEQFFFKLSSFKKQLTDYMEDKNFWKENVYKFTMNWIKNLEDRPITRNIEWGVKIPLDGYDDKRIYVWFDAVTGYLSASKEFSFWEDFWKDKNAKHYYFVGKDNIPFHTIIWPCMLLGYGEMNLPYNVPANEFLTLKGETFSKSRKRAVWVPEYLKQFEPDSLRYYLSINMPENKDVDFSWDDFTAKNNNELVATLGNFIHRILTFTKKNFGKIPEAYELDDLDKDALKKIDETFLDTEKHIENCEFKNAIKTVMELAHFGNKYLDEKAPWKTIKEDKKRCGTTIHVGIRIVKALSVLMYPFLPFSSEKLQKMIGQKKLGWNDGKIDIKGELGEIKPLFKKIEMEEEKMIDIEYFEKIELRVGEIKSAEEHPKADKLWVLKVDLGDEQRQFVAGLKNYYKKEELIGKKIVVVANLKPAKLRGVTSNGMLLAADDGKNVAVLSPDREVKNGARIK